MYSGNVAVSSGPVSLEERKVFVGGLWWDTTEKQLNEYCTKFGEIESITVKTNANTGRSRGFAFIVFFNSECIDQILNGVNHIVNGQKVDAKKAIARTGKNSSLEVSNQKSQMMTSETFLPSTVNRILSRPTKSNTKDRLTSQGGMRGGRGGGFSRGRGQGYSTYGGQGYNNYGNYGNYNYDSSYRGYGGNYGSNYGNGYEYNNGYSGGYGDTSYSDGQNQRGRSQQQSRHQPY